MDLTAALAKAGHDVTILTTDAGDTPAPWRTGTTPLVPRVVVLPPLQGRLLLLSKAAVAQVEAMCRQADVVHLHGVWEPSNVQVFKAARRVGTRHVVSLRGMLDDWPMSQRRLKKVIFLRLCGYELLNSASFIHCTAYGELAPISQVVPQVTGRRHPELHGHGPIREPAGPAQARAQWPQLDHEGPNVLFLSRVNYKKGVEIFIDMAKHLADRGSNARFVIAGSGDDPAYYKRMQDRVQSHGLGEKVFFVGMVKPPMRESLYQACELLAIPTSQENFGFVFYESLACAVPILTTYFVDTWPELRGGASAEICEPKAEEFAEAAERLLANRDTLREIGRRGQAWVRDAMAYERVFTQFERAYESALARPRP
jgi:glycosyltransferase involved in cell wall biosynthesis